MKTLYNIYYYLLFIFKNPKKVTRHHRFDKEIKYGFTVGKKHYYRLAYDYDMYENRFRYLKTYYTEVQNKLTSEDINEFADATVEYLNKQKYVQAGELMRELKYRSTWYFEPTSLYKYASVIYFDLSEDIRDYNVAYSHEKIEYWSKKKTLLRMLLKELMEGVDNLLSLSNEDFQHYISEIQRKKNLQSDLISESGLMSNKKSIEVPI